jgi:hypothetical protein
LQFKHPDNSSGGEQVSPHYWDIYSDLGGLKFFSVLKEDDRRAQRMIIGNNGNVGIGIANPLARLHIGLDILANGDITTVNKFVLAPDNNSSSARWEISRTGSGLNFGYFVKNQQNIFFIGNNGNIGIGKTNPTSTLDVNGLFQALGATINGALSANSAAIDGALTANSATIDGAITATSVTIDGLVCAKEVRVSNAGAPCWPDYVFNKDYTLTPLHELEQFITENQHLPNVPSVAEVEENGVELGEMNAILLQKMEELTIYIIQLENRLSEVESRKSND